MKNIRVSDTLFFKLMKLKAKQGFEKKDFEEWLHSLAAEIVLSPTIDEQIQEGTRKLHCTWMRSFGSNLPKIRKGKCLRDLSGDVGKGRAVIMGRGPSIFRKKHLDLLSNANFEGTIVASDGVLIDALKAGVTPDYVVGVDGAEIISKWYTHSLVRQKRKEIKVVLCTHTHPKAVRQIERAGLDIYWFVPNADLVSERKSLTRMLIFMTSTPKRPDGLVALECLGNAGATAWIFSWAILERNNVALIGMDYGYPADMPLKESYYYQRGLRQVDAVKLNTRYERVWHPFFKTWSIIDLAFKSYRSTFLLGLERLPRWLRPVNCTEGGTLWHPKLQCMYFKDWLSETDESEANK